MRAPGEICTMHGTEELIENIAAALGKVPSVLSPRPLLSPELFFGILLTNAGTTTLGGGHLVV